MTTTITIAVALVDRADGRTLLVRKRGSSTFIQPGGKLEPGESPADALRRELAEEIGLTVRADALTFIGTFDGPAVHEVDAVVVAHAFRLTVERAIAPQAEIADVAWIDPAAPGDLTLAPLTRDTFLPLIAAFERPPNGVSAPRS